MGDELMRELGGELPHLDPFEDSEAQTSGNRSLIVVKSEAGVASW